MTTFFKLHIKRAICCKYSSKVSLNFSRSLLKYRQKNLMQHRIDWTVTQRIRVALFIFPPILSHFHHIITVTSCHLCLLIIFCPFIIHRSNPVIQYSVYIIFLTYIGHFLSQSFQKIHVSI